MKKKFYMLLVEGSTGVPRKQHYEYIDAIEEAKRLMKQTNSNVYVLESIQCLIPKIDYDLVLMGENLKFKPIPPKSIILSEGEIPERPTVD